MPRTPMGRGGGGRGALISNNSRSCIISALTNVYNSFAANLRIFYWRRRGKKQKKTGAKEL